MAKVKTKRMGEILVEAGTVSDDQLQLALGEQKQTGEKLGMVLQRLGICTEREISQVLAGQAGVETIDLSQINIDRHAMDLIDSAFCEQRSLVAVAHQGSTLRVAMANPMDLETIDQIGRMTGNYIEVVHAPESEILDVLVRVFDYIIFVRDPTVENFKHLIPIVNELVGNSFTGWFRKKIALVYG